MWRCGWVASLFWPRLYDIWARLFNNSIINTIWKRQRFNSHKFLRSSKKIDCKNWQVNTFSCKMKIILNLQCTLIKDSRFLTNFFFSIHNSKRHTNRQLFTAVLNLHKRTRNCYFYLPTQVLYSNEFVFDLNLTTQPIASSFILCRLGDTD